MHQYFLYYRENSKSENRLLSCSDW